VPLPSPPLLLVGGGGPPRGESSEEGSHRIVGILLLGSRDSGGSHGMGETQRVLDFFLFFFFSFSFFWV
jgi:hypothetical protein